MVKKQSKKKEPLSEVELYAALEARFCSPEWALLLEVRNCTGYARRERYADAIAQNLWPSRGLELHGIEIKRFRGDWTKELKNPKKSAVIQAYCDRWWIVVADKSIVQPGELPPTWGLLTPHGKSLKCSVEAPKLEAKPVDNDFFAALIRRVCEQYIRRSTIDDRLRQEHQRGQETLSYQAKLDRDNLEKAMNRIAEFEEASGVKIDIWRPGRVGDAVAALLKLGHYADPELFDQLKRNATDLITAIEQIQKASGTMADKTNEEERG